jgi:hypothetical protein
MATGQNAVADLRWVLAEGCEAKLESRVRALHMHHSHVQLLSVPSEHIVAMSRLFAYAFQIIPYSQTSCASSPVLYSGNSWLRKGPIQLQCGRYCQLCPMLLLLMVSVSQSHFEGQGAHHIAPANCLQMQYSSRHWRLPQPHSTHSLIQMPGADMRWHLDALCTPSFFLHLL